jgi:hypothetical protein
VSALKLWHVRCRLRLYWGGSGSNLLYWSAWLSGMMREVAAATLVEALPAQDSHGSNNFPVKCDAIAN